MAMNPDTVVELALVNMKLVGLMRPGFADRAVYAPGKEPAGIPPGATWEDLEKLKIRAIVDALITHMRTSMEVAGVANGAGSASQLPPLTPGGPVPTTPPAGVPVLTPSSGSPLPPQPVTGRVR